MLQEYCVEIKKSKRRLCNYTDCISNAQGKTDKCIGRIEREENVELLEIIKLYC